MVTDNILVIDARASGAMRCRQADARRGRSSSGEDCGGARV